MNYCPLLPSFGATIHVTNDYPTIQAAINAANSNDTILVQAGTYRESLIITNSVHVVGSSSTNCLVHHTNDVLITITSAGLVELSGLGINGGELGFGGSFSPSVPRGIVATNTTVVLNDVTFGTTRNFVVTVVDGSLFATNVTLYPKSTGLGEQWDVGFQLKGCFARFYRLTQLSGQIDHTININDPPARFSDVRVENSTIQASHLGFGECVRTYTDSILVITNCYLFRAPGGQAVTIGNQAIGVNGYSNTLWITGNRIDNVPTGLRIFGSIPNSNAIKIERNEITNCQSNGVLASSMSYEGIDLGGGPFGSAGRNYFSNPGARDVELTSSSGNMHAISNCWTTANPDDSILDQLDNGALGRVTSAPTYCDVVNLQCSLSPSIVTNTLGATATALASVTNSGAPSIYAPVAFSVTSGPNVGKGTNVTTDVGGQNAFTYTSNGTNGTDIIRAIATVQGVSATGTATRVWSNGSVAPTVGCPSNIVTNNAAGQCGRSLSFSVTTNGVPAPSVTFKIGTNLITSPHLFSTGTSTVTCTASNTAGTNACAFTVTVNDTELPAIACPSDVVTNIPLSQTNVVVTFPSPTASDNCGLASTNSTPASGSAFPVGTNIVTCLAIDATGNTNACTFHVTVNQVDPPAVEFSASPTTGAPPLSVTFTDTSSGSITNRVWVFGDGQGTNVVVSFANHTYTNTGSFTVSLTVFGPGGSSNQTRIAYIVVGNPPSDSTPPSLTVTSPTDYQAFTNAAQTVTGTANDNSGIQGVAVNGAAAIVAGTNWSKDITLSLGTNTITVIATDASANANSATQILHAVLSPVTPPVTVQCSLVPDLVTNIIGFADNTLAIVTTNGNPAVGAAVTFSVTSGPNSGLGTNVTTDASGQVSFVYTSNGTNGTDIIRSIATVQGISSTCTATKVWFDPTVAPTIGCPSNITTNNAAGQCGRSIAFEVATNGVPAPTVTFMIGTNVVTSPHLFDVGTTTISCTATNIKGSDSCSFDVTVNDTELPSITCPADIATNIPFGQASTVVTFSSPTIGDNCALASTNVLPQSGSVFLVGTNTVVCTAVDISGNTNTCSFTVTVNALPPVTNGAAIRIVIPTNGIVSVDRTVNVNGWVMDNATVDSLVVTNSRGGSYSPTLIGTNWSQAGVALLLGTNQLTAVAHDDQSNSFSDAVIVIRVNTNYVDTTFRTTSATLTLGTGPNSDNLSFAGVYNDADVAFDPTSDSFEFLFGDYGVGLPANSLVKFKFKASASPSNTVTSVKLTTKKRTLTFAASGFTLTNGEPYMVATSLGTLDLGPDTIVFPVTSASGTFGYKYGVQLPSVDQFFLGKSSLTTNSFKLTGTLNVLAKPNVLTNIVSFGIGGYDESLPTNGWTKTTGNVYTYKRPAGGVGPIQTMTLNFDLGTWNATGSGADLSFLAIDPTTDFRLEVAEFAASYRAKLAPKGTKFGY